MRTALVVIWLVLCGLFGYYAPTLPIIKEYISIKEVRVEGTDKFSEEDIKNLVKSESWIFISEDRLMDKVKKYSFVESIRLDKPAFGVITIHVKERKPYGLVRTGDKIYLMDENGYLIENPSFYKEELANLKLITVDEENLNSETLKKIKKIDSSLSGVNFKECMVHKSIITAITEDDKIIILSKENMDDSINKFKVFVQKQGIKDFSYLNFSFDSMVIVKK